MVGRSDVQPGERAPVLRDRLVLLAVFAIGFLLRASAALELRKVPLFSSPQLDQLEFLLWARGLLGGGPLWPAVPTKGAGYAWFLALELVLTGDSPDAVRWIQAALGGVTCVLTVLLARRVLDRRLAVLAGLIVAGYGPLVYIEISLLAEGLFILLLVSSLLASTAQRHPVASTGAAGFLVGLAAVVRATALLLIPALAAVILLDGKTNRTRRVALFLGMSLLVVLPVALAVRHASGGNIPLQGYGGVNLYMGNSPSGNGTPSARLGGSWDRMEAEAAEQGYRSAADLDRYYSRKALREIREDPLGFARVVGQKAVWLLQDDEIRESHSFYFFRERSRVLRWLPGFGLLLAFAATGLVILIRRRSLPREFAVYLLVFAASCVGVIVSSRYRIPMVPVLAVLAAAGVGWGAEQIRRRERREIVAFVGVFVLALAAGHVWTHHPSHDLTEEWTLTGLSLERAGDVDGAERAYRTALELDPDSAAAWEGIAAVHALRGDWTGAERDLRKALALNPDYQRAHYQLAMAMEQQRRPLDAIAALREATRLGPSHVPSWEGLGRIHLASGNLQGADEAFREVLRLDPKNARARVGRARILGAGGKLDEALQEANRATELEAWNAEAWLTLAVLSMQRGDLGTAEDGLRRAQELIGEYHTYIGMGWAQLYLLQGKPEAVDWVLRRLLIYQPDFEPAADLLLQNAAQHGRRGEAEAFLRELAARSTPSEP